MSTPMDQFHATHEAEAALANIVSSEVIAFMIMHEQADHKGVVCWDERINTLAWLAHRAGIKSEQAGRIVERLRQWELQHEENCPSHDSSQPSNNGHSS